MHSNDNCSAVNESHFELDIQCDVQSDLEPDDEAANRVVLADDTANDFTWYAQAIIAMVQAGKSGTRLS